MSAIVVAPRSLTAMIEAASAAARGRPLRLGIVSDVHGQHKRPALETFCDQVEPDLLLCCGDLQDYRGGYRVPMIFTHGNHECWSVIDELDTGTRTPPGLGHLPDAIAVKVGDARVVGIGGCKASTESTQRKHINPNSVERLRRSSADIVLSHDTPMRFSYDPGRTVEPLREALIAMRPRFWFSGHHHRFDQEQVGRTTVVSLGRWPDEWGTLEVDGRAIGDFERFVPRGAYHTRKARWQADERTEKDVLFPLDRAGRRYGVDESERRRGR